MPHHFVHGPFVQEPVLSKGPRPQPLPCPKGPAAPGPPCQPPGPPPKPQPGFVVHAPGQLPEKPPLFQAPAAEVKSLGRGWAEVILSHSALSVGMAVREAALVHDAKSEYAEVGHMPPIPPCAEAQEDHAEVAVGRPFSLAQLDHSAEFVAPGRPETPLSLVHCDQSPYPGGPPSPPPPPPPPPGR